MQEIHQFKKSYDKQKPYEKELDKYFSKYYKIQDVNMSGQKNGVDKIFTNSNGERFAIDYKVDFHGRRTGNAFIETHSNYPNKLGWAYTSKSDYYFYYFANWRIYILITAEVKKSLEIWIEECEPAYSKNAEGYKSKGIKLPITRLKTVTKKIYEKDGDTWKPYTP